MFYNVDKSTGDLIPVAGGTLYADTPIGAWIKWDDQTKLPDGYLKTGDTITQADYPELYAIYGSTVPYKADTSELSYYENITISASSSSPTVMSYDGYLTVYATGGPRGIYINGVKVANASPTGELDATTTVAVKKSDQVYFTNWYSNCCRGAFYKKSLIVKARQSPVPADFMNEVDSVVDDAVDEALVPIEATLPYSFNRCDNISAFNRKFVYEGASITWTATHTGRLTLRFLKHGDGYSLYLNKLIDGVNRMMDSYDNFLGSTEHMTDCDQSSITLQAWVKKGDVLTLSSNLPSNTGWADTFFCQTGLLAYNNNYD